jgi:hypothetical protein
MNITTAIQIRLYVFVADNYDIPQWTVVSFNQKTVETVVATGPGGYHQF